MTMFVTALLLSLISSTASQCSSGGEALCLQSGRFQASLHWEDSTGSGGAAATTTLTDETGYFWFFQPDNVEVVLKVLDGRAINGHFWVFSASLSDVSYTLDITDLATQVTRTYRNEAGHFRSFADTEAFLGTGSGTTKPPAQAQAPASSATGCGGDLALCLADERFEVTVSWRGTDGQLGLGHPVPLTSDTGYFWFFNESNVELVLKVLDGRAINDAYWVFFAALSDVEYQVLVRDRITGRSRSYSNQRGVLASKGDTGAFPTQPAPIALQAPAAIADPRIALFDVGDGTKAVLYGEKDSDGARVELLEVRDAVGRSTFWSFAPDGLASRAEVPISNDQSAFLDFTWDAGKPSLEASSMVDRESTLARLSAPMSSEAYGVVLVKSCGAVVPLLPKRFKTMSDGFRIIVNTDAGLFNDSTLAVGPAGGVDHRYVYSFALGDTDLVDEICDLITDFDDNVICPVCQLATLLDPNSIALACVAAGPNYPACVTALLAYEGICAVLSPGPPGVPIPCEAPSVSTLPLLCKAIDPDSSISTPFSVRAHGVFPGAGQRRSAPATASPRAGSLPTLEIDIPPYCKSFASTLGSNGNVPFFEGSHTWSTTICGEHASGSEPDTLVPSSGPEPWYNHDAGLDLEGDLFGEIRRQGHIPSSILATKCGDGWLWEGSGSESSNDPVGGCPTNSISVAWNAKGGVIHSTFERRLRCDVNGLTRNTTVEETSRYEIETGRWTYSIREEREGETLDWCTDENNVSEQREGTYRDVWTGDYEGASAPFVQEKCVLNFPQPPGQN